MVTKENYFGSSSAVNALRVIVLELPCWLSNDSRLDIIALSSGAEIFILKDDEVYKLHVTKENVHKKKIEQIRIDFSFKREVFFVVVGAIVGAITFIIPKTIFETQMGLPYYLSWIECN
jgi:hypothetical protein